MTTIIDEWSSVKPPPAPQLKEVTIDPETTALLMLDLIKQTYNLEQRPRCLKSLPNVKKLLTQAKENQMLVVYSLSPGTTEIADTLPEVAPSGKEPFARSGVNKFYQTNLEQVLKEKNIQTLIIVGTAAHGAVLYTASEAVLRWVVPLSDQWFIETQDGARPEMGSGDIYWGQDIDTRAVDDNRGHRSGQIGNEPCVHLMIHLKAPQVEGVACPFAAAGASFSCSAGTREMGDAVLRAL